MDHEPPTPLGGSVAALRAVLALLTQCSVCKTPIVDYADRCDVLVRDDVWWKKSRSITANYACGCNQTYRFADEINECHPTTDESGNEIDWDQV